MELRKNELKMMQFEKETALADARAEHELRLNRMRLEFDAEELRMLKENPELLLLTPQAARLAEASQSLKNARTIVSLGPADAQGSDLWGCFSRCQRRTGRVSRQKSNRSPATCNLAMDRANISA